MTLVRAALLVAIAGVLACGRSATGASPGTGATVSASPSFPQPPRSDAPTAAYPTPPPVAARPSDPPAPTVAPTTQPGEAWVIVKVIDGSSFSPIQGATVRIDPYQREAPTDASGMVEFNHLPVSGQCRWVTIVVTASGYGSLQVVDDPLYPGHVVTFDPHLTTYDQRSYIGAPSGSTGGESFCSR